MRYARLALPKSTGEYLLLGFLALRLMLSLLTVQDPSGGVLIDSRGYIGLTSRLWETGMYSHPANSEPDLLRPPAYPIILFILRTFAGPSEIFISLVQLTVTGIACWALVLIGRRIGRDRVGLAAGWMLALSPNLALWSLTVMTEVWLALLIVVALAIVAEDVRLERVRWPVYSGLLLGVASYLRPIAIAIVPVWAALAFVWAKMMATFRKAVFSVVGLAVMCTLVMLPWAFRNWNVHGQFLFSTVTQKTWLGFNLAEVISMAEGVSRDSAVGELDSDRSLLNLTAEVAGEYPTEFVRAQLLGTARTVVGLDIGTWGNVLDHDDWVGLGLLSGFFEGNLGAGAGDPTNLLAAHDSRLKLAIMVASLIYTLLLFGLLIAAVLAYMKLSGSERFLLAFCALSAAVLLVTPLAAGQARFRVPAEPLLAFLAGYGLSWWTGWIADAEPTAELGLNDSAVGLSAK